MQELHHQTRKPLEGAWNAHGGVDFDEDAFGGMDVDLQFSGFVDGGVEERQETLQYSHEVSSRFTMNAETLGRDEGETT